MSSDLRAEYEARVPLLRQMADSLAHEVDTWLRNVQHIDRVCFRVKDPDSFVDKACDPDTKPPYGNPLQEIEDQIGGRVIVYFLEDVKAVANALTNVLTPVEVTRKRPKEDDQFGYESHHLVCLIPPQVQPQGWSSVTDPPTTFELQVRTLFMHAYAQPQHRLAYKNKVSLTPEVKRRLAWVAASAWGADRFYQDIVKAVLVSGSDKE
jgi:putative GTP pyrophosphokinase